MNEKLQSYENSSQVLEEYLALAAKIFREIKRTWSARVQNIKKVDLATLTRYCDDLKKLLDELDRIEDMVDFCTFTKVELARVEKLDSIVPMYRYIISNMIDLFRDEQKQERAKSSILKACKELQS